MGTANGNRLIQSLGQLLAASPPEGVGQVESQQIERLLEIYYRHISSADLEEHDPQDLLGALIAHWRLMQDRRPDEAQVRVYNPEQEEHGWRSGDTIVEVVARDMPFLIDSISAALNAEGLAIRLTIHPVFAVVRDDNGRLKAIHDTETGVDAAGPEAIIQMHVDRQPEAALARLQTLVQGVVADVTLTTSDWLAMKGFAEGVQAELAATPVQGTEEDNAEVQAFLNWMINDHFLFIACCTFDLRSGSVDEGLSLVEGSGLGLLRGGANARARADQWLSGLAAGLSASDTDLTVTKTNAKSSIWTA
jgi:glutamate dehydrogenase